MKKIDPKTRNTLLLIAALLFVSIAGLAIFGHADLTASSMKSPETADEAADTAAEASELSGDDTEESADEATKENLGPSLYALITVYGREYGRYDLSEDTEFTIEDGEGGYNVICIEDGGIYVREANCPGQDCVYMGTLREAGLGAIIACLPHGILITVQEN